MKTTGRFALLLGVITAAFFAILLVSSAVHAQYTGTGMSLPSSGGGGGGLDTAAGDARYLKLDASNDPLTGALTIPAGSAAAPGLNFAGDTNTGVYSSADGAVAFSGNGAVSFSVNPPASATNINTYYLYMSGGAGTFAGGNSFTTAGNSYPMMFVSASNGAAGVKSASWGSNASAAGAAAFHLGTTVNDAGGGTAPFGCLYGTDIDANTPSCKTKLYGTGVFEAGAGAVGTPTYSFLLDADTGIYSAGADQVGIASGGSNVGTFSSAGLTLPTGSAATPSLALSGGPAQNGFWADASYIYWGLGGSYSFASSTTTAYVGKNLAAAGTVGVNSGLMKMSNAGLLFIPTVQYPRIESQFADNTATYAVTGGLQLYSAIDGTDESAVALGTSHATATATTKLLRIGSDVDSTTAMVSQFDFMGDGTLQAGAGAVGTPTYSFLTDPNTGFYSAGADQVGVTVGGTNVGTFTSAGLTLPASTSTAAPFLNFSGTGTNSGVAYYDSGAQKVLYLRLNGSTVFSSSTTAYTQVPSYYFLATQYWGLYGDGSMQSYSTTSSLRIYGDYAGANLNYIATNADGTGETALAVGSRAVAGGQTTFAVCNDCDGTPSFLMKVQSDGDAQFGSGGIGDPSISFLTDPDTGFANASANELNVMAGGASIALFNANGLVLPSGRGVRVPSTSAASPSYTFNSASTTGIYNPSGTIVGIASGGAAVATFDSTGLTLAGSAALQTTLTGSGTLDFPSIGAGICEDLTLTVTGVAVNTPVACSFPEALEGKLSPSCWVTAADTVKFRICNVNMAGAVDPASGTFAVRSFQ